MDNTIDISVILPIESSKHKNFEEYFNSCISSVKNQITETGKKGKIIGDIELVIVHTQEEHLNNFLNDYSFDDLNVKKVLNTQKTDFCSQVNLGIKESSHKWISFIEFDDEYSSIWFKNVYEHINAYPDVKGFLPLVIDVDDKGVFAGFTNEATFAANMNTDIGFLTNDILMSYQNFQTSGMVIDKEEVSKYGMFKPSVKLTFVYELLLRLTHNNLKIMTVPKIGYKHTNMREGSVFWNYKNGKDKMSDDEVKFWIESAKKEYFFKEDRDIKFQV
jgi:hypothetical protein